MDAAKFDELASNMREARDKSVGASDALKVAQEEAARAHGAMLEAREAFDAYVFEQAGVR